MADDETQEQADAVEDLDAEEDADKVTGGRLSGDPCEGGQYTK
jgi:hypothetical protein